MFGKLPLDFCPGFRFAGRLAVSAPAMRPVFLCCFASLLLTLGGCEPSWRRQFPDGTKLYERTADHKYFGKVVGFEAQHDFHNGTSPDAAILIEPAEEGQVPLWGSCATCAATFQTEAR